MNELLMVNYLLEKTDDPGMKRWVLSSIVGRTYYHNFVTHLLEAHFQREVYRIVDEGGSLSAPLLHQLKRETLEKFLGRCCAAPGRGRADLDGGSPIITWVFTPIPIVPA